MKTINKIIKVAVLAIFSVVLLGGPIFAIDECIGEGKKYPNLSTSEGIYCQRIKVGDEYVSIYGKTSADCAQAGTLASDPDSCNGDDLNDMVKVIINTIIFVVGMVAVIMVILGGVSYATSQGDTTKVKKGKDTILYGIIGLVIAILAYAIVNFILAALTNG
ncbi:hypothetical protein IJV57_01485 [Candidatus Saccharibacteria bacterium]|jgi:hypothetical protein|nr:hypothetical protein [Candidatus Saccharibacteria bacterium]